MAAITSELLRRHAAQRQGTAPTAAAVLGAAIDAGILSLDEVLALARSCSSAGELGDALAILAATVQSAAQPAGG